MPLSDPAAIAAALDGFAPRLDEARAEALRLGRERYNWDIEKGALLASVEAAFARGGREALCRH